MGEKTSVPIIDDDRSTRKSLRLILGKKGYEIETAGTGQEATEKARERFFNMALLDIKLPDMEGIELIAPLKKMHPDIAVIMVTGHASLETAMRALNEGASAYITKPLNADEVLAAVRETLEKQRLVMENRKLYQEAQQEIVERKQAQEELRQSYVKLQRTSGGTVDVLVSAIEMRDPYTAGHQRRVTQLACAIANEMDLPEEQIEGLRMAGLIHDLGKMVLWMFFYEIYKKLVFNPDLGGHPSLENEDDFLGSNHSEVGKALGDYWALPEKMIDVIAFHHKPMAKSESDIISLIHIANIISHLDVDKINEPQNLAIDPSVLEKISLSDDEVLEKIRQILPSIKEKTSDISSMISS